MDKEGEAEFFPYQVMKKRLEVCKKHVNPKMDVNVAVQLFCSFICRSPADAVMWAYTLNEIAVDTGKRVDMKVLAYRFPWGFPDEEEMHKAWDEQKIPAEERKNGMSDNRVDDFSTWAYSEG